jgi:hypothetical protein
VRLQKERKGENYSHSENTKGGTSQCTKKKTAVNTHQLKITEGGTYQHIESRLEKGTHLLDSGRSCQVTEKEEASKQHSLSKESPGLVRT